MNGAEAYPLQWPLGWKRTPWRRQSRFKGTFVKVRSELLAEIKRLGGSYPVLSTNIPLRRDGLPYAGHAEPADPGVAVYFVRNGKSMVFACDKWKRVQDNMRAIQKTINAIRGMEAWGASEMMERTINAFEQLAAPGRPPSCWDVLGIRPGASADDIKRAHRKESMRRHPDKGGSHAAMTALNAARDEALQHGTMHRE